MRGTPVKSPEELVTYVSRWTVGATGAHTKVLGKNFTSVTRTAAGKYTVLFTEVPFGPIVDCRITHWPQADAEPLVCAPSEGLYTASAKTLLWESWVIDETAAQTEVPSGDEISISVTFLKTAV